MNQSQEDVLVKDEAPVVDTDYLGQLKQAYSLKAQIERAYKKLMQDAKPTKKVRKVGYGEVLKSHFDALRKEAFETKQAKKQQKKGITQ